jgi:hypothetical protein
MNKKQRAELFAHIEEFAETLEFEMTMSLIHAGHLSRDRMEFSAFCVGVEKMPMKIATSLPRPIYKNVIENGKRLVEEFPDDNSLPCKVSAVEFLLNYRQRIMKHLIEHHRHTEISTQRLDWDALFDFYDEMEDKNMTIVYLPFDMPPEMHCDCCMQSFDYDDVAEFIPQDSSKPIQYWCGDCMKTRTRA